MIFITIRLAGYEKPDYITINRFRNRVKEEIKHRGKRCIEPEAVLGRMKYNMAYRRFRHMEKTRSQWTLSFPYGL